jgi:hypothetical protein
MSFLTLLNSSHPKKPKTTVLNQWMSLNHTFLPFNFQINIFKCIVIEINKKHKYIFPSMSNKYIFMLNIYLHKCNFFCFFNYQLAKKNQTEENKHERVITKKKSQ